MIAVHLPPPRGHPRRRLRPLPRLRRPRRRAAGADRRRPDRLGTRLPSERELTEALGVSRTTVTRAYAVLRDSGYAEARQGSGTFTRVPGGPTPGPRPGLLPAARRRRAPSTSTARPPPPRPASPRRTPTPAPSCRRTSAGTATSPPASPSCRPRSRRRTTPAGCPPTPSRSSSRPARWRRRRSIAQRVHRTRRPGAGGVAGLPQRDAGDAARRRPAGRRSRSTPTAGTSTRSAPRCDRRSRPAGLPDPRLPEPHRAC